MKKESKFNLRSFTSFSLVVSTIIMSWSGFILYVAPPGRIANWGTWKLMLFSKGEWMALHTIFSYIFFILVIVHLFFVNWRTFLTYFKSKLKQGLNRKWELAVTLIFTVIIFIGTLKSWSPFGPVMAFGEKVKESWDNKLVAPPTLHMELYTIEKLALEFDSIASEKLIQTLVENKIKATGSEQTLKEIASENKTTPAAIYELLSAKFKKHPGPVAGEVPQGIGKFTVKSTAESSGKDVATFIQILKTKGVDANGETTLRAIAEQLGVTPKDVYNLLLGKPAENPK
jgi:hypothetical protein